jgi:hypothetical protein
VNAASVLVHGPKWDLLSVKTETYWLVATALEMPVLVGGKAQLLLFVFLQLKAKLTLDRIL